MASTFSLADRMKPTEGSLNLVEKMAALLASKEVHLWHFPLKEAGPRFYCWLLSEPENTDGYPFDTMEEMVEFAYGRIEPARRPLPIHVPAPHAFLPMMDGRISRGDLEALVGRPLSDDEWDEVRVMH